MAHDLTDVESQTPMAKCKARNFCGRSTKPASALGGRVDEFVVNTVRAGACLDASRQKDSLMDRDSGTDSLIRSASRTAAARSVVYVRRANVSSICLRGGAALLDEVLRVLAVKRLALLQADGDGVVNGHVLAVKGHLPGYLRAHGAGPRGGDHAEFHDTSLGGPGDRRVSDHRSGVTGDLLALRQHAVER